MGQKPAVRIRRVQMKDSSATISNLAHLMAD